MDLSRTAVKIQEASATKSSTARLPKDSYNLGELLEDSKQIASLPNGELLDWIRVCAKSSIRLNAFTAALLAERLVELTDSIRNRILQQCHTAGLAPVLNAWAWIDPVSAANHPQMLLPVEYNEREAASPEPWLHLTVAFHRLAELKTMESAVSTVQKLKQQQARVAAWRGVLSFSLQLNDRSAVGGIVQLISAEDLGLLNWSSAFPPPADKDSLKIVWEKFPEQMKAVAAYHLGYKDPKALLDEIASGEHSGGIVANYCNGLLKLTDKRSFDEIRDSVETRVATAPGLKIRILGSLAVAAAVNFPDECGKILTSLPPGDTSHSIRLQCVSGMAGLPADKLAERFERPDGFPDAEFSTDLLRVLPEMNPAAALKLLPSLPATEAEVLKENLIKKYGSERLKLQG